MINKFIDKNGINIDLYKRKQVTAGIDVSYEWELEKSFKGVISLKSSDKNMYNEKACENSTHALYIKEDEIIKSDLNKKIIANGEVFYINYIDDKLNNYPKSVYHTRVFLGRDRND